MNVSYKWLQRYFEEEIPSVEELDKLFSTHSFEVDGIENVNGDYVIDASTLPDRNHYLLGHRGVAKEIQTLTDLKIKEKENPEIIISDIDLPVVKIETDKCRRCIVRRVNNVEINDSPEWLTALLNSIGQRIINNIVDSTNFVMFDLGQPLHAFDADKIKGDIVVRQAKEGEKIIILGGEEKELHESDIVISDDEGPLDIAGIKGGQRAEVSDKTKNLMVIVSNFDPVSIRMTSNRLNLRNDASKRFENEITPDRAMDGMQNISNIIAELNPQAKIGEIIDVYPAPAEKWTVKVSIEEIKDILGIDVSIERAKEILEKMESVVEIKDNVLLVTPSLERLDMKIPADIADEIGRVIGYDHIESKLTPRIENPAVVDKMFYYAEKIKNTMIEIGFSETILYTLVNKGEYYIVHPLASDKGALRTTATGKMAESLLMNSRNADFLALDAIKLFEIGRVFTKEGEKTYLTIGVKQVKKQKGVTSESILNEVIASLNEKMNLGLEAHIMNGEYGVMAEFELDRIVETLPGVENIKDLDFGSLPEDLKYKPFSAFPFITRDVAVFVPKELEAEEVLDIILEKAGELCVKSYLFDVYEKDDRVSHAFRLIFQANDRTLTDEELTPITENIHKTLIDKGWEVR